MFPLSPFSRRLSAHLYLFYLIVIFCRCSPPPPAAHPAADDSFTNKTWHLKRFEMKEILGMVYKNKPAIEKGAADYLASGVSWKFSDDGKFTLNEAGKISEGDWQTSQKSRSLVGRVVTGEKERKLVFTRVYLTETTFSAELKSSNISYLVEAESTGN